MNTNVTVDLAECCSAVDRYAHDRGLSRGEAAFALIRQALTEPVRNRITGAVTGTVVQAGDVYGGLRL